VYVHVSMYGYGYLLLGVLGGGGGCPHEQSEGKVHGRHTQTTKVPSHVAPVADIVCVCVCYGASFVFYNAFLPLLVKADAQVRAATTPEEKAKLLTERTGECDVYTWCIHSVHIHTYRTHIVQGEDADGEDG